MTKFSSCLSSLVFGRTRAGGSFLFQESLINDDDSPACAWTFADILDISHGGFCLLITEQPYLPITTLMRLRLDLRPHPGFGEDFVHG